METAIWGVAGAFFLAIWALFTTAMFSGLWSIVPLVVSGLVFVLGLTLYVWFFTPLFARLDGEFQLVGPLTNVERRRRSALRSVASGQSIASGSHAWILASVLMSNVVASAIQGDVGIIQWLLALASFAYCGLLGALAAPAVSAALPLWADRLGRDAAPLRESLGKHPRVVGAAAAMVLAVVLSAPMTVGAAQSSLRYVAKWGRTHVFTAGQTVRFHDGITLDVPAGWSATLTQGDSFDAKWDVGEEAHLTPEGEHDERSIMVLIPSRDATSARWDLAQCAQLERKGPAEKYGPVGLTYRGWDGTASVSLDPVALRNGEGRHYDLSLLLQGPSGVRAIVYFSCVAVERENARNPVALSRRTFEMVDLRIDSE